MNDQTLCYRCKKPVVNCVCNFIQMRRILTLNLIVWEDGDVEIGSDTRQRKNFLGRQNHLFSYAERMAILSLVKEELEKHAIENQQPAIIEGQFNQAQPEMQQFIEDGPSQQVGNGQYVEQVNWPRLES